VTLAAPPDMRNTLPAAVTAICAVILVIAGVQSVLADPRVATSVTMEPIRIIDGNFELGDSGRPFTPWGFNYVGDFRRIVEEYWSEDWPRVEKDFREMRKLGANVVRLHLQVGTFLKTPHQVDDAELERLKRLLDLAQETGLYLDLTGLGCYHIASVPPWYDKLSESERWEAQTLFWEAIAKTCANHPAVFCYDLVNEPVVSKAKQGEHPWLLGELEGMYFVQRICNDPAGRRPKAIAAAWVEKLVKAIRKHDKDHLITVGVIPWALSFPKAKPIFYSPEVAQHLDFVSVHFYPKSGEIDRAVNAIAAYDIGKPLVVEEIFPLSCSIEELDEFLEQSSERVDGWISHYFGRTVEEHAAGAEPAGELAAEFFEYWQEKGAGGRLTQ